MIVIGENPALHLGVNWWTFWNDDSGFDLQKFEIEFQKKRNELGQRRPTRDRLDRLFKPLQDARIRCLETNVYRNEKTGGHRDSGNEVPNDDVLRILLLERQRLTTPTTVIGYGRHAKEFLSRQSLPPQIRCIVTDHFLRLGFEKIDAIAREILKHQREGTYSPESAFREGRLVRQASEAEINARANEKARKRKAARTKMLATKTIEKGLLIVHTGKGKGKSTAAFGLVMRAIGNGLRVGIVQFVKGKWQTGERPVLERFPDLVDIRVVGEGFTWDTQDRARDIRAAEAGWAAAREMIDACRGARPRYDMILLDELNIVLRYDYLPLDEVVEFLMAKPEGLHVIVTGRNAKPDLIEAADLVTEMTEIKHPFRAGVKAQKGIEF